MEIEMRKIASEYSCECPHCEFKNDLSIYYPDICDANAEEVECESCNKSMCVTADVRYSFTATKR